MGCISGLITIILGIYVSFTIRGKGPILSNSYIYASKTEKEKIDKKSEYKLVSIVFSGLAIAFLFLTLYSFTLSKQFYILFWCAVFIVAMYAIIDSIKTIKRW